MLGGLSIVAVPAIAADQTGAASRVRFDGQRLSLHVEHMPFGELLATLERSGLVKVVLHGDPSSVTVSDSFGEMDVAQALRRVLSTHSHVLIDRGPHERAPRIIELILFASQAGERSGAGSGTDQSATDSAPVAPRGAQSPADVLANTALSAASAGERAAAAEELAYRSSSERERYADQVLAQQLSDPDEQVRRRALETIKDTAETVPVDAVAQVAREDASAERRVQALELLAERGERRARRPLHSALADPAPEVSKRARELIEDWHLDSR
jgi:hypothetical protein